jgi:hypothetical protein
MRSTVCSLHLAVDDPTLKEPSHQRIPSFHHGHWRFHCAVAPSNIHTCPKHLTLHCTAVANVTTDDVIFATALSTVEHLAPRCVGSTAPFVDAHCANINKSRCSKIFISVGL